MGGLERFQMAQHGRAEQRLSRLPNLGTVLDLGLPSRRIIPDGQAIPVWCDFSVNLNIHVGRCEEAAKVTYFLVDAGGDAS
jgi:hypothetical protein